jgi:hypothetical protein
LFIILEKVKVLNFIAVICRISKSYTIDWKNREEKKKWGEREEKEKTE